MVGGRSILDAQLSILRGIAARILIVGRDPHGASPAGVTAVADRVAGAGALGGVFTALSDARTEQVLVLACDMPFLTAPFLEWVVEQGRTADVAVPRDGRGRHPLCASYARRVAPHFERLIAAGELRMTDALEGLDVREIGPDELDRFDRDGRLLMNVNTPGDYARASRACADHDVPLRRRSWPTR